MLDKKQKISFWSGTFSLALAVIFTKILGVMFKVPLSYILADEGMGYFNAAYSIYSFFYILSTAGVPKAVTLIISEYNSEYNTDTSEGIVRVGMRFFLKIGLLLMLINIILAPMVSRWIGSPRSVYTMLAIAPAIVFVASSGVLRGFLNTRNMLTSVAISQVIEGAVKLVLGLVFAFIGQRLNMAVYMISALAVLGITAGCGLGALYLYVKSKKQFNCNVLGQTHDIDARAIQKKMLKTALPISLSSSVISLAAILDMSVIMRRIMAMGISERYAVAIYGNYTTLAIPMFNLVIALITPLSVAFLPQMAKLHFKGDSLAFAYETEKLMKIGALISAPFALIFYFYSFDLLDVLFSVNSSAIGAELLTFLSIGVFFLSLLTMANTALEASGRIKIAVISLLLGSAVKITISYYLMSKPSIGILGAPLGSTVSYFFSLLISLFAFEIGGTRIHFLRRCLFIALISASSFVLPYFCVYKQNLLHNSFLSMIFSILASMVTYSVILFIWYFAFDRRKLIKDAQNV